MESMQDIKVPVCRLCLEVDCYSNFQQLENGNYLKITALTTDPVICSKCKEMLQKSSCFKTACKQTEDHLKNIRINNTSVFNELFNRELGNDTIKENIGRCRLCLREAECCSALCVVKYMLEKCFPEMDMTLVQNPVICNSCIEDLQGHYNLIVSCLDIEDKIRNYHVGKGVTLNNTNLHEIRLSSIKMESRNENYNGGSDDSISKRIKLEDEFRGVKTIKTEEISVKDGADGEQKKGKMAREVLNPQSRKLVLNVVEYFQNKKESSYESICVINCAAEALKLSPRTISRIRQEGRDGIKKKIY
ncbi:hypothetical protein NQ317_010125 [Molorchus minor]|uniref:ZAD domain-containing protein n=1 Tax=Molorchus minor TaxID=1323400 RepID=A0ABQ9JMA4_9CUCU|nr:hypothetical protein NQ317_010125 [Molorchus minor]